MHEDGTRQVIRPTVHPSVQESAALIRNVLRGTIRWQRDPLLGVEVPVEVAEGIDLKKFDPRSYYDSSEMEALVAELKQERIEWLEQFPNLDPAIMNAVK